ALERWERMLQGGAEESLRKQIALITGEWHPARELSVDGQTPRWSADGTLLAYTSGEPRSRVTTVVDVSGGQPAAVATVQGHSPTFSSDGRTLYVIRVESGPALQAAVSALESASDAATRRAAAGELQRAEREASRLVSHALNGGAERIIELP